MDYIIIYDKTNPQSIEEYAKKLIGHTFNEIDKWNLHSELNADMFYNNKSRKGGLGNFIEEKYFGYRANSDSH